MLLALAALMAPPNHKTADEVDAGSRYGVKAAPKVSMHNKMHDGDDDGKSLAMQQRLEARRLNEKSQSQWIEAVERGEMVRIKQLLEAGQDINQVCYPQMSTAVYVASRTNNLRVAEMLLKAGADPAVLTDDLVSPLWIAISRGFDKMVELLLDKQWSANLVKLVKEETTETLRDSGAGVQQTHMQLATTRRYWRCVYHLEQALEIPKEKTAIPTHYYQPPEGWAVGMTAAEPGQRPDMPMKPFYWKAFEKGKCYDDPPEGSKKLVHQGDGTFAVESTVEVS